MSTINNRTANSEKPWPITAQRYVAFIDIMGFKDMVLKMSHIDVYNLMKSIDRSKKLNENLGSDENEELVRSTTYSDSIMFYSRDGSNKSLLSFVASISGLIHDLFVEGIPHKGAFAFGKMTLDIERSIFFGQPLIDAYLLQEELHFYGIVSHGTSDEKLGKGIENKTFIKRYDCPLKNGKSPHYTIYPIYGDNSSSIRYPDEHRDLISSLDKMRYKTSGHLRRYIDNTEAYFNIIKTIMHK